MKMFELSAGRWINLEQITALNSNGMQTYVDMTNNVCVQIPKDRISALVTALGIVVANPITPKPVKGKF